MSEKLEWREPTIEELAEWNWDRHPGTRWLEISQDGRDAEIELWSTAIGQGRSDFIAGRDLYTLARAIEFERRAENAWEEADNELLALTFDAGTRAKKEAVEKRNSLEVVFIEARQRVNALTAKVLGQGVGNGIDVG